MRTNYCLVILHASIAAALLFTSDADSKNSKCEVEIKVSGNPTYEAVLGEDLRIHCTVSFCDDAPPRVSWYKLEETKPVPVNVSSGIHILTEWKLLNCSEGILFLIFRNIHKSESGVYQCRSGRSGSQNINVSVHATEDAIWICVWHAVRVVGFFVLMLILCVVSRCACKGKSKKSPDLSRQPSYDANHIYENDP